MKRASHSRAQSKRCSRSKSDRPSAIDANAAIDVMRPRRPDPPPLNDAKTIVLPLPVLGELLAGAMASMKPQLNLDRVTKLRRRCELLTADEITAHVYGEVRAASGNVHPVGMSK